MTTPAAVRWLTYPGDRRGSIGNVMGPNTIGELLQVVTEEFDAVTKATRLGLTYDVTA